MESTYREEAFLRIICSSHLPLAPRNSLYIYNIFWPYKFIIYAKRFMFKVEFNDLLLFYAAVW